jgi:hypothetical protein
MADEQRTDDLQRARREAAELLGLDVERPLCPADALRIDLVCALRRVVDAASETVLEGGTVDLSRLVNAVETLIGLLPKRELPQSANQPDPREAMWRVYKSMRDRGEAFEREQVVPKLTAEIAALRAELAALRGGDAAPVPASPVARAANVVALPTPPANSAPAPAAEPQPRAKPAWETWLERGGHSAATPGSMGDRWSPPPDW